MPTLDFQSRIDAPAEDVFAWHERPGAFERLVPPWMNVELQRFEGIGDGQRAIMKIQWGPVHRTWIAMHEGYEEGKQFRDVQRRGPFKHWTHTHRFAPHPSDEHASVLHDHITYDVPLGGLGRFVAGSPVRKQIEHQFAYRHRITRQDLALHRHYRKQPRLKVAISGSSGLIGHGLKAFLKSGGHEVVPLVRHRSEATGGAVYWNHKTGEVDAEGLEGLDAVVHLAAENIFAPRWTQEKKTRIYASRVKGTRLIADTLADLSDPPDVLISASAIGYYGDRGSERLTENSPPGERSFMAAVCREWEATSKPAAEAGIRVVNSRTGIVLSPAGGALQLMRLPFRAGLGGTVGDKGQYFSWVALDDAIAGLHHALMNDSLEGPVNLTAPHPATMQTFVKTLAGVLNRPSFFHIPKPVVQAAMGQAGDEFALTSARVLPARLLDDGYDFLYPDLEDALRHQLGRTMAPLVHEAERPTLEDLPIG